MGFDISLTSIEMLKNFFDKSKKPDLPRGFGYKTAWYAAKSSDFERLSEAFKLTNIKAANWEFGLSEAYKLGNGVFVTPPLNDWTLVVGQSVFPPNGLKEEIEPKIDQLKMIYDDVQLFFSHRIVEAHGWARAVNGKLVRGYSYAGESGETLWDEGSPSNEERELGYFATSHYSPDEEDVMRLAKMWSLNPSAIEEQFTFPSLGYLGKIGL